MPHSDDSPLRRARHAQVRTSRVWERLPAPRPMNWPSRQPRLRAWLTAASALVALLGLSAVVAALWLLPGEYRLEQAAVQLRESGLIAVADGARVVQEGSGRYAQDSLEASFRTREQQVITVRLLGSDTDWSIGQPPQPLTVFYDPARPDLAMAADDLRYYADDAVTAALIVAALGGLTALVGGSGWWMWQPLDH